MEDEIKRNMAKARQVIASIENMMLGDLPSVLEEPLNWNRILHWSLASLGASMFSKPENLYSYMRWQADYIYTKNEAADREGRFQLPIRSLFRFLRDQSGEPVVFVDYGLIKYAEDHYVKVMKDLPSYFLSNKEGSFPKWWRHLAHLEVLRSGPLVGRQCVCPFKGRKIIAVPNAAQIDLTPLGEINDDEMRRIVRGSFLGASYSSSATLEICEAGCLLKLGSILGWPGITSCD
ncbi:hypothetical protein HY384_00120 [Candidatus Daviesbacteria bacterium]|nr:hypothetical protein [Candidatus Daviesbacteria bacterium]